jgi:hypothetical protein
VLVRLLGAVPAARHDAIWWADAAATVLLVATAAWLALARNEGNAALSR